MRKKIFVYYVILIFTGVSFTGFLTSHLTRRLYEHEIVERLKITANLIEYQLSDYKEREIPINYNNIAAKYADILDSSTGSNPYPFHRIARITFIDSNGNVLGESGTNYESMENHASRREVQHALKGLIGTDKRFSNTLKMDFIYLAVPIEATGSILRIAVPLTQVMTINRMIIKYSLMSMLAGIALTILLAYRFSTALTHPIKELISVSGEISQGCYLKRVKIKSNDELGELAETFNEMAEKLQNTFIDITDKNVKLDSIINSMTDAVIAVDSNYKIMLINTIACQLLSIKDKTQVIGTNILELLRNNTVASALEKTLESNASTVNDITKAGESFKVFRVRTNPIKSPEDNTGNSGSVITIQESPA